MASYTASQSLRCSFKAMITIPDNVYGAVIISIIDFLLSFVIISGIGAVLWALPLVNRRWKLDDTKLKEGH